jgi:hypothetical protein
MPDALSEAVPT